MSSRVTHSIESYSRIEHGWLAYGVNPTVNLHGCIYLISQYISFQDNSLAEYSIIMIALILCRKARPHNNDPLSNGTSSQQQHIGCVTTHIQHRHFMLQVIPNHATEIHYTHEVNHQEWCHQINIINSNVHIYSLTQKRCIYYLTMRQLLSYYL